MTNTNDLETLAATVRHLKDELAHDKSGLALGRVAYEKAAATAKALSNALFDYSKAKFPSVTPRRVPYQALLR